MSNHVRCPTLQCPLAHSYQLLHTHHTTHTHTRANALSHSTHFSHPARLESKFLTILIVFEIVIRAGAPAAFRRVPQVLELQEVGPFAPEAQKGGRKSPGQGHQTLGAAGVEKIEERSRGKARGRGAPTKGTLAVARGSVSAPARRPRGAPAARMCLACAQRPSPPLPSAARLPRAPRLRRPLPSDTPMLLAKGNYFQKVNYVNSYVWRGARGTSAENTGLRRSGWILPLPGWRSRRSPPALGPPASDFGQISKVKAGICLLDQKAKPATLFSEQAPEVKLIFTFPLLFNRIHVPNPWTRAIPRVNA